MRSTSEHNPSLNNTPDRELTLLDEIERSPVTSQRQLARRTGAALGLTNLLIRSLARRGYVRVTKAGWRRWVYSLTPAGIARRVHLTRGYVSRFLMQYRQLREALQEELDHAGFNPESRVALCITGELGELVYLGLRELGIEEIEMFAPRGTSAARSLGMPVHDLATLQPAEFDRVVTAQLLDGLAIAKELEALGVSSEQLVALHGSGSSRSRESLEDAS